MSAYSGPGQINDGLVFQYDMANPDKSWKGKPTDNLLLVSNWNSNLYGTSPYWYTMTRTIETSNTLFPGVYVGRGITDSAAAYGFGYIDFPLPTGTTAGIEYACSFWYKSVHRTASVWCHDTTGANTSYSSTLAADGNWNRGIAIFTSTSSGKVRLHIHTNGGSVGDVVYFTGLQIEQQSSATPFVDGTRSNTQAIVDLTGQNTVTANSLTYNSDGTFSFNGSSDYLIISSFVNKPTTQITCEAWVYPTKPTLSGTIRGGAISATNSMYLGIIDSVDGGVTHAMHWANQTSSSRIYNWNGSIPNNGWSHLAGTYDGATTRAYLNGIEIWSAAQTGTIPDATYYLGTYGPVQADGVHTFNGTLPSSRIYNRALSAAEVQQNFAALRARYGL